VPTIPVAGVGVIEYRPFCFVVDKVCVPPDETPRRTKTPKGQESRITGRAGLSGIRSLAHNFRPGQLDAHYDKHVIQQREFGNISKQEYLHMARSHLNRKPGDDILEKVRPNGDRIIYNRATNEFRAVDKDGYVKTYFKPRDSINYFHRQ